MSSIRRIRTEQAGRRSDGPPTFLERKVGKRTLCEISFRFCKEEKNYVLLYGFVPLGLPLSNSYSKVKGHCYCYVNSQVRAPRSGAAEQREELFWRRVPPCGADSFLSDQKGTKESLGAASGERLRAAGAHSHCPQTPGYGGRPPGGLVMHSRRT